MSQNTRIAAALGWRLRSKPCKDYTVFCVIRPDGSEVTSWIRLQGREEEFFERYTPKFNATLDEALQLLQQLPNRDYVAHRMLNMNSSEAALFICNEWEHYNAIKRK